MTIKFTYLPLICKRNTRPADHVRMDAVLQYVFGMLQACDGLRNSPQIHRTSQAGPAVSSRACMFDHTAGAACTGGYSASGA